MLPVPPAPPACSIVLTTLAPWTEIRGLIRELVRQAEQVRGEVVVADGLGRARPDDVEFPERLRWIPAPDKGVFALRLAAVRASLGEIVVSTEDHCYVDPEWCQTIIDLHNQHPDADVIKGRVDNGSTTRTIDRAGFMVVQWRNVPPIDPEESVRMLGIVGVAFKRRAVDALQRRFPDLTPELLSPAEVERANLKVVVDTALRVTHVQSESWWGHGMLHFHNARAIMGARRGRVSTREWLRVLAAPLLVPYRAYRVIQRNGERSADAALAVAPAMTWLYLCKGAGECLGVLAGPGNSPRKLH